jgi:hypothetical protein
MSLHYDTFAWVDAALERSEINRTEFDVLFYCCHRVLWNRGGWDEMRVPAYAAAQVCRFYGEDATETNRQRYKRAWRSLRERYILCHDYKQGVERPYNVWLPLSDPFAVGQEARVSLYTPLSQLLVPAPVPPTESASDTQHEVSQQDLPLVSQPVSQHRNPPMSLNTQSERESPPVPQGGGTQLPLGCAQTPHGLSESTPAQGNAKSTALTADQCKQLDAAVSAFRTAWAKHYTFDPSAEDVRKLLRAYCPLEVFFAYEHLRDDKKKLSNAFTSAFFNRTAVNVIRERRKASDIDVKIGLVHPIRATKQGIYDGFTECILDFGWAFDSVQAAWCELFSGSVIDPPLRMFWKDSGGQIRILSFELHEWQRKIKDEFVQQFEQWMSDFPKHLSDDDCGLGWAKQNCPKSHGALTGFPKDEKQVDEGVKQINQMMNKEKNRRQDEHRKLEEPVK